MTRRPRARAAIVTCVGLVLIVAGSTAQAGWLYVLAAGVLGIVAASLVVPHRLRACEITRSVPRRTRVGDDIRVGIEVRNRDPRPVPLMRFEDRFGAFEPLVVACPLVEGRGSSHVELMRRAHRRGVFDGGEVCLSSGWPFGLFTTRRRLDVASRIEVVPRWVELRSFPILEQSSYPVESLHERARLGAGLEYVGVRDYRAGDPLRAIHWRSSARAGRLVAREYEEDQPSRVALVLAGGDAGAPPESCFEALVSAAASVGIYALTTGHRVDVVRAGEEGGAEALGDADRSALLGWLAAAHPRDVELRPLVATALKRVGRRGTVVVLSPTQGRAGRDLKAALRLVQSSGARSIAIAARSSTWDGGASSTEEEGMLARLGTRSSLKLLVKDRELSRCLEA